MQKIIKHSKRLVIHGTYNNRTFNFKNDNNGNDYYCEFRYPYGATFRSGKICPLV